MLLACVANVFVLVMFEELVCMEKSQYTDICLWDSSVWLICTGMVCAACLCGGIELLIATVSFNFPTWHILSSYYCL